MSTAVVNESLTRQSVRGAAWAMAAYGASQALRLASSLLLTRLLAPEHFGLMAIVNVFMIGLNMLSDVGIGPNIIQSRRGDDQTFLNAAWSLQALRGGMLWAVCLIGAWPFALFYAEPRLAWLIPVSGLTALISGFNSTKIFSAYRGMQIGQVTLLELGSQVAGVLFTVACALVWPSIWALVLGGLFAALFKLLASHSFLPGINNRPCLEPGAMQELVSFGRWIILSTFLSFTTNSAASLILGKFMTVSEVGIFAIASTLANIVQQAYEQICSRVLLPLYSRIKDLPQDQLRSRVRRVRIAVMLTFAPPLCAMVLYGQALIEFLLDPRYHSGGWILQLFAASALPLVISGTSPYYLSTGNSLLMMKLSAARLGFYLTGCVVGWYLGGAHGIIWGIGLHTFASYLVDLAVQHRYRIWVPQLDLAAVSVIGAVLALGLGLGSFR